MCLREGGSIVLNIFTLVYSFVRYIYCHVLRPDPPMTAFPLVPTSSVSSIAWFMSNQEECWATLGQRVLANPLRYIHNRLQNLLKYMYWQAIYEPNRVRMHYGDGDIVDRIFHITRGGISKASRGINASEDIFAGLFLPSWVVTERIYRGKLYIWMNIFLYWYRIQLNSQKWKHNSSRIYPGQFSVLLISKFIKY